MKSELSTKRVELGLSESKFLQVINFLTSKKKLYNIEGNLIHAKIVDQSRIQLLKYLSKNKEGTTVADFRDLIKGNRKICILMLNIYDSERILVRDGDVRTITEKGEIYLRNYERSNIS